MCPQAHPPEGGLHGLKKVSPKMKALAEAPGLGHNTWKYYRRSDYSAQFPHFSVTDSLNVHGPYLTQKEGWRLEGQSRPGQRKVRLAGLPPLAHSAPPPTIACPAAQVIKEHLRSCDRLHTRGQPPTPHRDDRPPSPQGH